MTITPALLVLFACTEAEECEDSAAHAETDGAAD